MFSDALRLLALALLLAGCAPRGAMVLLPEAADIGTTQEIFVATSRDVDAGTGVHGHLRNLTETYERYAISIPPERELGTITWAPRRGTPDPRTQFLTTAAEQFGSAAEFRAAMGRSLRVLPKGQREAVVFVHGFNTNFAEGVYRIAQFGHDLKMSGVVAHYAWPSRASPLGYVYDRDSALFARDGLERLILETSAAGAERIILVAHSMGANLTMEALRQMSIRGETRVLRKVGGVVLISPDIDVDVFKAQASAVGHLSEPFVVFTSRRDMALALSARITGERARLGNLRDVAELKDLNVTLLEVGAYSDGTGHFTPGTSPALIQLLSRMPDINTALRADELGRVGLLPGAVLTVQNATQIILSPVVGLVD